MITTWSQNIKLSIIGDISNLTKKDITYLLLLNTININEDNITLKFTNNVIDEKIISYIPKFFKGTKSEIKDIGKNIYAISNPSLVKSFSKSLKNDFFSIKSNKTNSRSFIKSCFISFASICNPEKYYHVEFVFKDSTWCFLLQSLLNDYSIHSSIIKRGRSSVVYIKDSESIGNLLRVLGANKELFELENILLIREVRSNINRQTNFETANIERTVNSAVKQINDINYIEKSIGLSSLDPSLIQIAELRLKYPDESLSEIALKCDFPISKSGLFHRLKKIEKIAYELRRSKND